MNLVSRSSLRFRLMFLVVLAVLPLAALQILRARHQESLEREASNDEIVRVAELTSASVGQLVEGTRQVLTSLSHIQGLETSQPLLTEVLGNYRAFANIGVVQSSGLCVASAVVSGRNVACGTNGWFRQLQASRGFTIGDYQLDMVTGRPCIHFAVPLSNQPARRPLAAVFVTLPLESVQHIVEQTHLPAAGLVVVVDRNGLEIARNPGSFANRGKQSLAWRQVRNQRKPTECIEVDGVHRHFYFSPVPGSDRGLWVGVGFSQAAMLAETRAGLIWGIGSILAVALVGVVLVWYGINIWVLHPVHSLAEVSRRLAGGDLGARTNATGGPKELRLLASSFNEMASSLQKKEAELRSLNLGLEQRVRQRTNTLESMNQSLVAEINKRQEVEQTLRENQRVLATLMSNLPGMVYRCRIDGEWTLEFASEGTLELTGYSPTDLVHNNAMSFGQLIHPDDRQRVWEEIHAGLERREPYISVYRILTQSGTEKWISERGRGIFSENGELVALEGFAIDTTTRKNAEDELYRAHVMLELIIDNIPQRVFWKDANSIYLGCNQPFARDGSLASPYEVVGKTDTDLFSSEAAALFRSDDRWVMDNNTPKIDFEEQLTHLDGTQRWLRTSKVPLQDRDGNVIGVLGAYEDVTERKEMERKLRDFMAELERSNRDLEEFAYVASHDLQEPLRLVSGYTQLLSQRYKGQLDQKADEFIGFAVEGVTRMQRLIQDLLAFSRVSSKDNVTVPTDCNVALNNALANLSVSIEENAVQITVDSLPTVMAAENLLTQLFQNLIGNAIKFRGTASPQIHVSARQGEKPQEWIISVADNGIGIEPEFFDRIFVIFQRLHSRRKYAGTGIGLAICRRIVERHGGRIWVESTPGQGSVFCFALFGVI